MTTIPQNSSGLRPLSAPDAGDRAHREGWTVGHGPGTVTPALLAGELVVLVAYLVIALLIEANPFADALINGVSASDRTGAGNGIGGIGLRGWLVVLWLLTVTLFAAGGAYRQRVSLSVWEELPALSWRSGAALATIVAAVDRLGGPTARNTVVVLGFAGLGSHLTVRLGVMALLRETRASRRTASRTVVLGGGTLSCKTIELLDTEPGYGLRVLGYVDDVPAPLTRGPEGWTYLGQVADLPDVVRRLRVQTVLVGFGAGSDGLTAQALRRLTSDPPPSEVLVTGLATARPAAPPRVQIFSVPRLFEVGRRPPGQDHAGPIPLDRVRVASRHGPRWGLKRALDVAAAVVALAVAGPVLGVLAASVRLECGPGHVVVGQERVGRHGLMVRLWRFRTARPGGGPGPVGRVLRRTWLGRLPVLWNLLRGDVSVVGPRPETPAVSQRLQQMLPHYEHRLQLRGGLVDPGAVAPCAGDPPADEAVLYDTAYVENWGLWTDATVLAHGLQRLVRKGVGGVRSR